MTLGWTDAKTTPQLLMQRGATIIVELRQPESAISLLRKHNIQIPPSVQTGALIDTGATRSAIDITLAKRLTLIQTDVIPTHSASGLNDHPVLADALYFKGLSLGAFDPIPLIGVSMNQGAAQCLIGRDLLANVLMIYSGPQGQITLAR